MGEMIAVTAVRTEDAPWMADTIVRYAREHGVDASPVDEFRLDDAWVFVDFWRRLGITVPDVPLRRIRLDAEACPRTARTLIVTRPWLRVAFCLLGVAGVAF